MGPKVIERFSVTTASGVHGDALSKIALLEHLNHNAYIVKSSPARFLSASPESGVMKTCMGQFVWYTMRHDYREHVEDLGCGNYTWLVSMLAIPSEQLHMIHRLNHCDK